MRTDKYSEWKWPEIKGLESFAGDLVHSASWPENLDYKNKRVAVIGNGSSGVQIVPALQPDVKSLVHFTRSPTWILPPPVQMMAASPNAALIKLIKMDDNNNFTPEQIEEFKNHPDRYLAFVKAVEAEVNSKFKIVRC